MTARAFPPARPTVAEVRKNAPAIAKALRRRGVPEADVEDVLQEVLMASLDAIKAGKFCPDPLDPPGIMLRVWMFAIARNCAYTFTHTAYFRHEKLVYLADFPAINAVRPHPNDALAARSALRMLDRLTPVERAVLTDLATGWKVKDIAARDGVPTSTVWNRVGRARRKLARLIKR